MLSPEKFTSISISGVDYWGNVSMLDGMRTYNFSRSLRSRMPLMTPRLPASFRVSLPKHKRAGRSSKNEAVRAFQELRWPRILRIHAAH